MSIRYFLYAFAVVWLSACSSSPEKINEFDNKNLPAAATEATAPPAKAPYNFPEDAEFQFIFEAPRGVDVVCYTQYYDVLTLEGVDESAQIIKTIADLDSTTSYYSNAVIFYYVQLRGMANKEHERLINKQLKPDIAAFLADHPIVLASAIDSAINTNKFIKVDLLQQKEHTALPEDKIPDRYSATVYTNTINCLYKNIASLSFKEELDGNVALHPNFWSHSLAIDLATYKPLTIGSLLYGNYLPTIKKHINEADLNEPDPEFCGGGEKVKNKWTESVSAETYINYLSEENLILEADTRQFGCGEALRDIMEVTIPLSELKPYLKQ